MAELRSLTDWEAKLSVPMLLDDIPDAETARKALSASFDGPDVVELVAYTLGDGEAMSGILVAGRRHTGEATFLVFLMD